MAWPPLKRHRALQPFSREHMGGLVQARQLSRAVDEPVIRQGVIDDFLEVWEAEIRPHFDDEERLLVEMIHREADRNRLITEHREIRGLVGEIEQLKDAASVGADRLGRLGRLLHDHIRWEERVLFEEIQSAASDEDLEGLEDATAEIERTRPGSCARRRL